MKRHFEEYSTRVHATPKGVVPFEISKENTDLLRSLKTFLENDRFWTFESVLILMYIAMGVAQLEICEN